MQTISSYLILHRHELVWALVFAVVFGAIFALIFAVLFDLLPITSQVRNRIRQFRNKLAEQSAGRIRKRIKELEKHRESVAIYLVSDKAHYLSTLRFVLGVLMLMGEGASLLLLGRIFPLTRLNLTGEFDLLAFGCFLISVVLAVYAVRIASLDSQSKISAMIKSIDSDIEKLKAKLSAT